MVGLCQLRLGLGFVLLHEFALHAALDVEPELLYDAVWKDTGDVLPSLTTYFRSKFSMSDDQIAIVKQFLLG